MAINNNFMSHTLGYVLMGVSALVGMGFIVRMVAKCKGWSWRNRHMKPQEPLGTTTSTGQIKPIEPVEPANSVNSIIELLRPKVERFSGNFCALRDIANDKEVDIRYAENVFKNVSNVIEMQYGDDVKKWYSSFAEDRMSWNAALYSAKATKLMELFVGCGVTPSDETELIWCDATSRRYNRMMLIDEGTSCEVLSPCWMLDGILIEKGMVGRKG